MHLGYGLLHTKRPHGDIYKTNGNTLRLLEQFKYGNHLRFETHDIKMDEMTGTGAINDLHHNSKALLFWVGSDKTQLTLWKNMALLWGFT